MSLTPSSGGPIGCAEWDALVDVDGFLALGRNRYHCSYVIYTDGTNYYAENGDTGQLDYGGPTNEGGVSGTDASAVIQTAYNALGTGETLLIKPGAYTITTMLGFNTSHTHVFGYGALLTLSGITTGVKFGVDSGLIEGCTLAGLRIDADSIAGSTGMLIRRLYRSIVKDIRIENAVSYGIDLQGPSYDSYYENIFIDGGAVGFGINSNKDTDGVRVSTFSHIYTRTTEISMELFDYVNSNVFLGLDLESVNLTVGLMIGSNVNNNQVFDNLFCKVYVEGPGTPTGIRFGGSVGGQTGVDYNTIFNAYLGVPVANRVSDLSGRMHNYIKFSDLFYATENHGTATMLNGTNSIVVAHGLGGTPTIFSLTGEHAEVSALYVTAIGAANFTINKGTAGNVTANRDILWEAKMY